MNSLRIVLAGCFCVVVVVVFRFTISDHSEEPLAQKAPQQSMESSTGQVIGNAEPELSPIETSAFAPPASLPAQPVSAAETAVKRASPRSHHLFLAAQYSGLKEDDLAALLVDDDKTALFNKVMHEISDNIHGVEHEMSRLGGTELFDRLSRGDYIVLGPKQRAKDAVPPGSFALKVADKGNTRRLLIWQRGDSPQMDKLLARRDQVERDSREAVRVLIGLLSK